MVVATNRFWAIRGFNGTTKIYERFVHRGCFTEHQIQEALKALVAKAGLELDEIVGAYAKRNTEIANKLLSVRKDAKYSRYYCGENPHFSAEVVDKMN